MKKILLAISVLLLIASVAYAEENASNVISDSDISLAIEKIKSVLTKGWNIVKVDRGEVHPVHYPKGQGVDISIVNSSRKIVDKGGLISPVYHLTLMNTGYEGKPPQSPDFNPQVPPSQYLGKTKAFKVYWYGMWGEADGDKLESVIIRELGVILNEKDQPQQLSDKSGNI